MLFSVTLNDPNLGFTVIVQISQMLLQDANRKP